MGSSTVRIFSLLVSLICSNIEASVVDLPEPVVPVTITRPRLASAIFLITSGRFNSSNEGISVFTPRIAIPGVPR